MVKTQPKHTFTAFLLTLFTCQILLVQGRHLKSVNKVKFSSTKHRDVGMDLFSGHTPFSLLAKSTVKSKSVPNMAQIHSSAFRYPVKAYKNDNKPESSGNCVSVGHASEAQVGTKGSMIQPDQRRAYLTEEHQVNAEPDVLNPNGTNPGQSPGVGHVFASENDEAKSTKQSHF